MRKKVQSKDKSLAKKSMSFTSAAGSFFAACMLFVNMSPPEYEAVSSNKIINGCVELLRNLSASFDDVFFQITLICAAFVVLSGKIKALNIPRLRYSRIFSLFLAVMWTFGKSFSMTNDLHLLVSSPGQMIKAAVFGCGSYYLAFNLIHLFYYFLEKRWKFAPKDIRLKGGKSIKVTKVFGLWDRHSFAFPFVFLLIVWAPYTFIAYPGNMCSDAFIELCQYFGTYEFTTHHPPLYTLLLGGFVRLGRALFNSSNAGLFAYVLFQYVTSAAAMAYTLFTMKKLNAPTWLRVVSILIYGFMPHFSSYVALVIKDIPYCMAFAVVMCQMILMTVDKEKFMTKGNIALTIIAMTLVLLLRNNGKHVLLPMVAVLIIQLIIQLKNKKTVAKKAAMTAVMLVVPFVLSSLATSFMVSHYNLGEGSVREVFSLPFQQTARYVRDYADQVTEEERAAIDKVLDYDRLGELYDENICDPVKATFKDEATTEDLIDYFMVWFKQFIKHPVCYFEATLNQNYYMFYPFDETLNMYIGTTGIYELEGNASNLEDFGLLGFTEFKPFSNIQSVFVNLFRLITRLPFLSMLCSISFYILILCCLVIYAINKKNYNFVVMSLPLLFTVLVIIAGPVILTHPRYAFPIAYTIPLFISYYLFCGRTQKTR